MVLVRKETIMWAFKFVTDKYESPGGYDIIHYKFGETIEVTDYAPAEDGQCARGIHVIPVSKYADFDNCVMSKETLFDFQQVDAEAERERTANYLNAVARLDTGVGLVS